jgi:putative FmdB family regulatory protein
MPVYEFECRHCGHIWDALQKISDPDPALCPSCPTPEVYRRMTAAAFRLKGAGWYETDFKKDGDTKRNLVDSASADSKSDNAKSDSKSDNAKSDSKTDTSKPESSKPDAQNTSAPAASPAPAAPSPTPSATPPSAP